MYNMDVYFCIKVIFFNIIKNLCAKVTFLLTLNETNFRSEHFLEIYTLDNNVQTETHVV